MLRTKFIQVVFLISFAIINSASATPANPTPTINPEPLFTLVATGRTNGRTGEIETTLEVRYSTPALPVGRCALYHRTVKPPFDPWENIALLNPPARPANGLATYRFTARNLEPGYSHAFRFGCEQVPNPNGALPLAYSNYVFVDLNDIYPVFTLARATSSNNASFAWALSERVTVPVSYIFSITTVPAAGENNEPRTLFSRDNQNKTSLNLKDAGFLCPSTSYEALVAVTFPGGWVRKAMVRFETLKMGITPSVTYISLTESRVNWTVDRPRSNARFRIRTVRLDNSNAEVFGDFQGRATNIYTPNDAIRNLTVSAVIPGCQMETSPAVQIYPGTFTPRCQGNRIAERVDCAATRRREFISAQFVDVQCRAANINGETKYVAGCAISCEAKTAIRTDPRGASHCLADPRDQYEGGCDVTRDIPQSFFATKSAVAGNDMISCQARARAPGFCQDLFGRTAEDLCRRKFDIPEGNPVNEAGVVRGSGYCCRRR